MTPPVTSSLFSHVPVGLVFCFVDFLFAFCLYGFFFFLGWEGATGMEVCFIKKIPV